jgi:acyl-CoA thioesterase-1
MNKIKNATMLLFLRPLMATALFCIALSARGGIPERLKNGENLTIAAIGTSLTDKNWNKGNGWFEQTGEWLNGLPYTGKVTLSNRAVCGSASKTDSSTTDSRCGFLQLGDVLANDNPDAIFIEFAINDAYLPYKISLQGSKDNLQAMIREIRDWAGRQNNGKGKKVDIVVQTMNNCSSIHASQRPGLSAYYQGFREVVKANPGVLLIDNYHNWLSLFDSQADHSTWNSYVPDGIHPNANGARNIILPAVQKALNSQIEINS